MYPELMQFKSWLKCQDSNSSASVHYSSDLALFFSFVTKAPATVTSKDVDRYISHSLQQGNKPAIICDLSFACIWWSTNLDIGIRW